MDQAIHRRLDQELGMTGELQFLYKFQYQASYEDIGSENEICWVYIGVTDDEPEPNANEISDHRWIVPGELDAEMDATPERFTPWFRMEWERVREAYRSKLEL